MDNKVYEHMLKLCSGTHVIDSERRTGKSTAIAKYALKLASETDNALILIVCPLAINAVHLLELLRREIYPYSFESMQKSPARCRLANGSIIEIVSAGYSKSRVCGFRGIVPDLVIVEETQDLSIDTLREIQHISACARTLSTIYVGTEIYRNTEVFKALGCYTGHK